MRAPLREWMKSSAEREAWTRFLIGVFGLILAFACAVMSSATREAGNLLATALLASFALLLAGIVGLATVPYLAKRVALRRVKSALNYDVTREGGVYLLLTLVIAIAALNTGNNLLFIVVSAMIAAVLVSGVASALVLLGVEASLDVPGQVFAGEQYVAVVSLRNTRRWLPAFSVHVSSPATKEKKGRWEWKRTIFEWPKASEGKRPLIRWPDMSLVRASTPEEPRELLQRRVYFAYIPALRTLHADVDLRFERRGRVLQNGLAVSSRFPFSFLLKTRIVPVSSEVIVYPSIAPTDEFLEVLPLITGEFESYVRGRGYDLYRIREYQPEDSARHVDWKSTAKSGSLKVREFTREDERKVRIVWDNPRVGALSGPQYEKGVELAASLAWHFAKASAEVSFAAPGYSGVSNVYDFLEYLALTSPSDGASVLDDLPVSGDFNVILTTRTRGTIPSSLWQSSYFMFLND